MQYAVGWNQRVLLDRKWESLHSKTLKKNKVNKAKIFPALLLFAVLVLQLHVRLTIVGRAYEVERLRDSAMQKQDLIKELKLSVEKASDPDLLMQAARSKLGLELTPPQRVRKISL